MTVALLRRGAAHVSAVGHRSGGDRRYARERSRHADPSPRHLRTSDSFDGLAHAPADLLVTNPPQRPRAVWEQLPADARGVGAGGEDGLEMLEIILAATRAPRVITSISTLVGARLSRPLAGAHGFDARDGARRRARSRMTPSGATPGPLEDARVRVWELQRA